MQLKEGEKISIVGGRAIAQERVIFAGHGLPVLAAIVAKKLYNPDLQICFESGAIYSNPEHLPHSVSDIVNYCDSMFLLDLPDAFGLLEREVIKTVGISGAQVDKEGNVNSTLIRGQLIKRLPGSGGACDFASLGANEYIFMLHEPKRLVDKVDYITSPGLISNPEKRVTLITNYGIFSVENLGVRAVALENEATAERVKNQAGFNIEVPNNVKRLNAITEREISLLRKIDAYGILQK